LLPLLLSLAVFDHDAALSAAFTNHLKETEQQVARLEKVGELLEIKPAGKKCEGMEGVIKEGAEALEEEGNETVLDLRIIGAGSRVEHYKNGRLPYRYHPGHAYRGSGGGFAASKIPDRRAGSRTNATQDCQRPDERLSTTATV
jgi:hypothetical protein